MRRAKRPKRLLLGRAPRLVPVTDSMIQLRQTANVLRLIEAVGTAADLGEDGDQLMRAMKFARKLVEQVIAKLAADKRRKGGAK